MIFENQEYPELPEGAVLVGRGGSEWLDGVAFDGWVIDTEKPDDYWCSLNKCHGATPEFLYAVPTTSPLARHAVPTGRNKLDIPLSQWPDWANWAAMDDYGEIEFYRLRPVPNGRIWVQQGKEVVAGKSYLSDHITDWRESLTARPVVLERFPSKSVRAALEEYDPVNHPPHYTAGGIECIDAIIEALGNQGAADFCRGNVIKYTWRAGSKDNASQDMAKAEWYAKKAKELLA